ncbi:CubicO group peptidase (beta-lactamase class C family) [Chryseobacterium rhizosphaerae]|uniref:serine hydrolase domain-containing protein n=1 Tax=Chryseobacterium rhizosphaerae TaxID=395937 RepID=UPI002859D450|nr:serine hydrolase domain-containing protein [Chryseobacterium rhizosphaerae]MDR6545803.1 CubicO group peptidase (beta-lactamase class C family) [Chryseobacterium rhizosphaerae]
MKPLITLSLFLFSVFNMGLCFGQFNQKDAIRRSDSLINTYSKVTTPGMAIGIIKDGKVIYKKTYGRAHLEHRIPITDSTAFDIASVSKQFTAFIVLLAEKEGKLSLNDDIRTYLPELNDLPYKITIRQLASHTHGLPEFSNIKKLQGFGNDFRVTNTEAVQTVLAIKSINFFPGEQYSYNNTGFILLAEILHRVYKKDFKDILKEVIFKPLHMNNSMAIDDPEVMIPNKAESYHEVNAAFLKSPLGQMENGSSNIFTTLNDLCKWVVNYQKPLVGSREIYNTMQKNTVLNSGEKVEYGLGLQTGTYKGLDIVFHGGGTAGYRSYILHIPAYHLSIVLAGNGGNFDGLLIAYKLVDLFLGEKEVLSSPPKKRLYTSEELKRFEGIYELNPGNYLSIISDGKELYMENSKTPLVLAGDNKFDIPFIPTGSFTFHTGSVTFRVGDFVFIGTKVTLNPLETNTSVLRKYTGFYRNKEFNTIYQLVIKDGQLVAIHPINSSIQLYHLSPTTFYSFKSHFGRLDFTYDQNKKINGFLLAGANMSNIKFEKLK